MGQGRTQQQNTRRGRLWQVPLLFCSFGLFGYAAYLFIDPHGGPTVAQKLDRARKYVQQDRPDAAIPELNGLLKETLTPPQEGAVRVLLGQALETWQQQRKLSVAENHENIVRQTESALKLGIEPDAGIRARLGASYEALGRWEEAVAQYEAAAKADGAAAVRFERRVIELRLAHDDFAGAAAGLDGYLKRDDLAAGERAWAMGEKAHVLVDRNEFAAARKLLAEALRIYAGEGAAVQSEAGRFNYWLGYCLWKLGDPAQAEKHLRVARDLLTVQHPLDAESAWAIGRIRQDAEDYPQAEAFYNAVLQSHLGSRAASVAKLGRGVSRIARGDQEAGLGDLTDAVRWLRERPRPGAKLVDETVGALKAGSEFLASAGNFSGALELMTLEQDLRGKPDREFFGRLARVYERRANQLQALVGEGKPAERIEREARVRETRARAGDAWVAYSRSMVLSDDKGFGEAMWKGIELYETCGDVGRVISALETFVNERPEGPLAADAMLKLGNSYHAAGLFDKAIGAYKRCQGLYPRSLAASKSGVALARAYVAKGPDSYGKAEGVLRSVIDDNPQITPDAVEFREALAELANLHHRNGQFELAIARLDEMTQRYPQDERMGQLLFLMGDCYRKSAQALEARIATQRSAASQVVANAPTTRPFDLEQATVARRERLEKARDLFRQVVEHYKLAGPRGEADRLYQKMAHFYQADCVYDLGDYMEAIKCYDDAAFRYQDDPSALAAYVQIVNANVALGRLEEAKTANERAKWMLRRMPADVFTQKGGAGMGKEAWERWLEWSTQAGLWK